MPYPPRTLVRESAVDQLNPRRGTEIVHVAVAWQVREVDYDRIQLVDAADVVHVGVDLVPQPEVEREVRCTCQSSCTNAAT